MLFRQTRGEVGHAGTAENDDFGIVFSLGEFDFGADQRGGIGGGIIERKNRHFARSHLGAPAGEPVFQQIGFDRSDGTRQRRDDREAMTQHRGQMKRRFPNSDDRRRREAARRLKAGIIEACHDVRGNGCIAIGGFSRQSRYRERLVIIAFD